MNRLLNCIIFILISLLSVTSFATEPVTIIIENKSGKTIGTFQSSGGNFIITNTNKDSECFNNNFPENFNNGQSVTWKSNEFSASGAICKPGSKDTFKGTIKGTGAGLTSALFHYRMNINSGGICKLEILNATKSPVGEWKLIKIRQSGSGCKPF